jgi:hypothetical protein
LEKKVLEAGGYDKVEDYNSVNDHNLYTMLLHLNEQKVFIHNKLVYLLKTPTQNIKD